MTQILLNKKKNINAINVNNQINIELKGNRKLLPSNDFFDTISSMDVYDNERKNSNKIRLTITIYPYCSNVLFNNITEIVNSNQTDYLTTSKTSINGVICKNNSFNLFDGVKDTQLSNNKCNYQYYCGLNIFNNHLLRSSSFKAVCYSKNNNDNFNTLYDYMREENGEQVKGYVDNDSDQSQPNLNLHLYLREDIDSFQTCVNNKLKEKNGWLGFINTSTIDTYYRDESLNINKIINNAKACEFIYMYPTPDLFYFTPKFNEYKNRYEKNWNYCLTYPSYDSRSLNDDDFNINYKFNQFINKSINSLKLVFFEEKNNNLICYSITQHGLKVGDKVNIYLDSNNEVLIQDAEVISLGDINKKHNLYVFTIKNNGVTLSHSWKYITNEEYEKGSFTHKGQTMNINPNKTKVNGKYYIINNKVNLDDTIQNVSFKKIVSSVPCDYYVRFFSKIPNWKFANKQVDENSIYSTNSSEKIDIQEYQKKKYDFSNVNSNLAYAKTVYNDDVSQIVFTDDIDLSYLHDNLGRPLHEVFLTIMKNNKGYKEWYGVNNTMLNINSDEVEYSHAFGKVTHAFKLSHYSLANNNIDNVLLLNNIDDKNGYGEINYNENEIIDFIGDICCYSSSTATEQSIQTVSYRFNTAQRELKSGDTSYETFKKLEYDEIITDDYDYNGFKTQTTTIDNVCQRKEGYYYKAHYQIPIHSLSELQSAYPTAYKIVQVNGNELVLNKNFTLQKYDKCILYNIKKNEMQNVTITNMFNTKTVVISGGVINDDKSNYRLLVSDSSTIPKFAQIIKDGTCRYAWRNLIINGYDNNNQELEQYPFSNGAFYINKRINFYLLRQDPHNIIKNYTDGGLSLKSDSYPFDYDGNQIAEDKLNNYYEENDMLC